VGALVSGIYFCRQSANVKDLKFSYACQYKAAAVPPYDSTDYKQIKDKYMPIDPEALRLAATSTGSI
jgi:hypothetical protein